MTVGHEGELLWLVDGEIIVNGHQGEVERGVVRIFDAKNSVWNFTLILIKN